MAMTTTVLPRQSPHFRRTDSSERCSRSSQLYSPAAGSLTLSGKLITPRSGQREGEITKFLGSPRRQYEAVRNSLAFSWFEYSLLRENLL